MTAITKLTGSALLEKVAELGEVSKTELVTACGYTREDGTAAYTEFYENLMAAKGINITEANEEDEYLYQVCVPVYVSLYHYGKKGMTRDEVLKAFTFGKCSDGDIEHIGEMVEDSIKRDDGVSVYDDMGEKL